jgi:opacity protein-like surface antigen
MKIIAIFVLMSSFWCAEAAYIEKIRGRKALIYLDGLEVQKGDLVNAVEDPSRKAVGIFRITTVKDGKAIGELLKGKAKINQDITFRKQGFRKTDRPDQNKDIETPAPMTQFKAWYAVGGMLGLGFDSMDIKIGSPQEFVSQSGVGYSLIGTLDYRWIPWISIRGMLGIEQFKVDGKATLGTTPCSNCKTEISYVSSMAWGRFHITQTDTTIWIGPGVGYFIPTSKDTNALDSSSIKNMFVFGVAGGVDLSIHSKLYIPVHLEYVFLNDSEDVKANFYAIKTGLMFKF